MNRKIVALLTALLVLWTAASCLAWGEDAPCFGDQPTSFKAICVPSPQSMSRFEPSQRSIREVSQRCGIGIIPPVPRRHTSNIIYPIPSA